MDDNNPTKDIWYWFKMTFGWIIALTIIAVAHELIGH